MSKSLSLSIVLLAACAAASAQTYTVLYNFGGKTGDPSGLWLDTTISQGRGGDMFTASRGNPGLQNQIPAAFRISPLGSLHILHQWSYSGSSDPQSGLILGTDGRYYGVTVSGGPDKLGTVFRLSASGADQTLHDFTGGSDGSHPWSIIQSAEGDFYITTEGDRPGTGLGSGSDYGSIFRMTKDGNMTLLHAFNGTDGWIPMVLVQGTDFRFYGTTVAGGSSNNGTIFRISSSGEFQVLHNFDNTHGSSPQAGLIQATDGNFYGTTADGGATDNGVLFRIAPSGHYTDLHEFTSNDDGAEPEGRMVQASDGNLYGTNMSGGTVGAGMLFRATLDGVVSGIHAFSPWDGSGYYPRAALFQHTNGKLYGGTWDGGQYFGGVFYSLDAGLPPFVTYLPVYGRPGAEVQILGQGFTDTSQVSFNGMAAASVSVIYPTFIKATVPAGATTGPITVTSSTGTLTSNKVFIVHPQ